VTYYARPGAFAISAAGEPNPKLTCLAERIELWTELIKHVRADAQHAETIVLVAKLVEEVNADRKTPLDVTSADVFVTNQIVFNETVVFAGALGAEAGLLAQAVPEYALFSTSQQSTSNVQDAG